MKRNHNPQNQFVRVIKRFFYSAFLVITFIAYALENRGAPSQTAAPATSSNTPTTNQTTGDNNPGSNTNTNVNSPNNAPVLTGASNGAPNGAPNGASSAQTSNNPASAKTNHSGLKDGTYTGPEIDIRWGYVKVQTTIQNGQIANVQFLEYPTERRTSARINSYAVPILQQEAVQAQSANVNIITGATLTSEGFQMSLQSALSKAGG
jgi:uncharacterized protein with FMN-binding domain